MRRRQLLFATYNDEGFEQGFSYAVDLAKTLEKDLQVLLVDEKKMRERLEDLMSAVAFAEEGGVEAAKDMQKAGFGKPDKSLDRRLMPLLNKSRMEGVGVEVSTASMKITQAINDFIKQNQNIDMVLLGPTVAEGGNLSGKDLKKLVSSVSKPVVTMARHGFAT